MGELKGFLKYDRKSAGYEAADSRVKHYNEFIGTLGDEDLSVQGARCMDCGIPFCHYGCPVSNLIPEFNHLVYKGLWREAWDRLEMTNNFPEFTGRICPAPCESSCTLSINQAPVTIKQLELTIVERAFAEGWVVPKPPQKETGFKVAVIGSGPAGLAASQQLRRMGHKVTLFEKSPKIGGLLRYGIPDFKLDKKIIDRRLDLMAAEGVEFETDVVIGEDISAKYLRRKFDIILVTTGAGHPRDLPVPGRDLEGVHFAMEFLSQSNAFVNGEIDKLKIDVNGKNVLVIGGGDTGSDCVGTSNRQGAKSVHQFEILPKPRVWDEAYNPQWPDWPTILRTSSSHEEGCSRDWSITTNSFEGKKRVQKGNFARVEWEASKDGGRPTMKVIDGSEFSLDIDYVFLAMGFVHVEHNKLLEDLGVEYDGRGNISTNSYASSVEGVYAAGDSDTGASLIVRAINHGRRASEEINNYLMNK